MPLRDSEVASVCTEPRDLGDLLERSLSTICDLDGVAKATSEVRNRWKEI